MLKPRLQNSWATKSWFNNQTESILKGDAHSMELLDYEYLRSLWKKNAPSIWQMENLSIAPHCSTMTI